MKNIDKSDVNIILEAYNQINDENIQETDAEDVIDFSSENNEEIKNIYKIDAEVRPGKKYNQKSMIEDMLQRIFDTDDFDVAKNIFIDHVKKIKINPNSKIAILSNIRGLDEEKNLAKLQQYIVNSMFKFKKMGLK